MHCIELLQKAILGRKLNCLSTHKIRRSARGWKSYNNSVDGNLDHKMHQLDISGRHKQTNSSKIYALVSVKNPLRSLRYSLSSTLITYDKGCSLRISELVNFFHPKLSNSLTSLMRNDNREYNLEINHL